MLNPSRLYSFIDRKNGFAVHFLEGQKLIYDLILTQSKAFESFSYFRSTILSFLPMITFLKNGESLGIYLDSENPYFRFKMETNFAGHTRTLLLPEEFSFIPQKITGQARVTKQFQNQAPYTSIVEFSETASSQISNIILTESYQTQSVVNVSQVSDQSILIIKLPPIEINKIPVVESLSLIEYQEKFKSDLEHVFNKGFNEVEPIVQAFESMGLVYLTSRQVQFFCPCSKEYFLLNMQSLYGENPYQLFGDQTQIEVKCDYCLKKYHFIHKDFENPLQ